MKRISNYLLPLAILAYTAFNSRELIKAWLYAPLDWLGWLPFVIWLIPLFVVWRGKNHPAFLWGAVGATLLGNLASFNALRYAGFSAAIASWAPFTWGTVAWWAGSIAWMPAFGWLGSRYFPDYLFTGRLVVTAIAVACYFIANQKRTGRSDA